MPIRQQAISQLHNAESQIERKMTLPTKLPAQFIAAFSLYFRSNTITIGLSWPGICFVIVKVFRSAESPI